MIDEGDGMMAHQHMALQNHGSALARQGESAIGYNLLVATIFAGCLPVTVVRSVASPRRTPRIFGPFAAALETAHCAAAQVYSLPG